MQQTTTDEHYLIDNLIVGVVGLGPANQVRVDADSVSIVVRPSSETSFSAENSSRVNKA